MRRTSNHPGTSPQRKQGFSLLPCLRCGLAVLLLALAAPPAAAETIKLSTRDFLLGPEVVFDEFDKVVRLVKSVLIADEIGATDFHQTETLSDRVHAKKIFKRDSIAVTYSHLYIYHAPKKVSFDGTPLVVERLPSTGWSRAIVPWSVFTEKTGDHEVVLSGGGSLLLEPGRAAGRSLKSTDGGSTWSPQLGKQNDQQGEYLVRLRLGRYAPRGWAMTPVFDLWGRSGSIVTPAKLVSFPSINALVRGQPKETEVRTWLRTGSTSTPDTKAWTDWIPLDKEYRPDEKSSRHRWAQLRFELITKASLQTPRLPAQLEITFVTENEPLADKSDLTLLGTDGPRILQGATPFVYQEPSPRLKLLRERYQLDKVIAPGKTEMEQLMLLRYWIRNQWHTAWKGGPASWMPPWDALIILESKDQTDCLTMCTHYAAVFTQCSQALGWNARHCILDHHGVSEVWVDQHRKWVMMDTGNSKQRADVGLHFEKDGVPLSALELHVAHQSGKTDGIQVRFTPAALAGKIADLCRPDPRARDKDRPDTIPLAELKKYPVCQIANYRRYAFPARNNYLASLLPGELYQGWSSYFYDGYCWVGDSPDDPKISPEYSRHLDPSRPQDIDWSLNWMRIHLARTGKPGELRVDLESGAPNLARLERWENETWKPVTASFPWKLQAGENALKVRSVNRWDRAGAESQVRVKWTP